MKIYAHMVLDYALTSTAHVLANTGYIFMYTVFTDSTPNPYKVTIMLEELGVPYEYTNIDFSKNEQKSPDFLGINPNGKVPVLIDHERDDFAVVESGAILLYLAEKHGKLLPKDPICRSQTIQWLMWQMAGLGPMFGQLLVFAVPFENRMPVATSRYQREVVRLLNLLNNHLAQTKYLAADQHTLADIAVWPWVAMTTKAEIRLDDYPHLQKWFGRQGSRKSYIAGVDKLGNKPDDVRLHGFKNVTVGIGA